MVGNRKNNESGRTMRKMNQDRNIYLLPPLHPSRV